MPAREALKATARDLMVDAALNYASGNMTVEGAYKAVLKARVLLAASILRSEAAKSIVIELGQTVDFQEMKDFRNAVGSAMATGQGGIEGLWQFYDGGMSQYLAGVIKSADPTGIVDVIEEMVLTDSSVADAMNAVAQREAAFQAENAGLPRGALEVQEAFLEANRILYVSLSIGKPTYKDTENADVSATITDQDGNPIDVDSISFSVSDNSGIRRLEGVLAPTSIVGIYSSQFSVADLGATGEFILEATALRDGYVEGQGNGTFTVTQGAFLLSDPASYDIALPRSAQWIGRVTIENTSTSPTDVSISTGGHVANWISLAETSFSLGGWSASKVLYFNISVPSGATPETTYLGSVVLSYDGTSLTVPVVVYVTAEDSQLALSASVDGDFDGDRRVLVDERNIHLSDQTQGSIYHEGSFQLTTDERARLIMLEDYVSATKTRETGLHSLALKVNGQDIWTLSNNNVNEFRNIMTNVMDGDNPYRYGIAWPFNIGGDEIEYVVERHQVIAWLSKEAWSAQRSYPQSTLDAWRAGWYGARLEVQINTVHHPGNLYFFLNGKMAASYNVYTGDAGRKIRLSIPTLQDASRLFTENHFNLKGSASNSNTGPPPSSLTHLDLGPIEFKVVYFSGQPDITVMKQVEPATIYTGEIATVTITLRNNGSNVAWGADFTDVLPPGLSLILGSLTCAETLIPEESATFKYSIRADNPGIYFLPATDVRYKNPLGTRFNSSSEAPSLTVRTRPELSATASLDKYEYNHGESAVLTATVTDGTGARVQAVAIDWSVVSDGHVLAHGSFQTSVDGTGTAVFNPSRLGECSLEIIASKLDHIGDSDSKYFEVVDIVPPTIPNLLLPLLDSYTSDPTPTLEWAESVDLGSGVSHYVVQVAEHTDFSDFTEQTVTVCQLELTSPLADGQYYWHVKAVDAAQNESQDWSSTFSFTLDTVPPTVIDTEPHGFQDQVALDTHIRVTFSERMHRQLTDTAFSITPAIEGSLQWEESTLTFTPSNDLAATTMYTISLEAGTSDLAYNGLLHPYMASFSTETGHPPATWYVDDDAPHDPGPRDPCNSDSQEDGSRDHPFDSIQEGINAAFTGDAVVVRDGLYRGIGNRDVDFGYGLPEGQTRIITVRSQSGPENCIIDCQGTEAEPHRAFSFHRGETSNCILEGITIRSGYGRIENIVWGNTSYGGAIFCDRSSPTFRNCIIEKNKSGGGAGMCCYNYSAPIIYSCEFRENWSSGAGGGILCDLGSSPRIDNCWIINNSCGTSTDDYGSGAGIYCHEDSAPLILNCVIVGNLATRGGGITCSIGSSPMIINATISGNTAIESGGGIYCYGSAPIIKNCILWDNTPNQGAGCNVITYSNIQGYLTGTGNIANDPCFVAPGYRDPNGTPENTSDDFWIEGDYRLRFDSSCIDTGDPNYIAAPHELDGYGGPRILGGRVDIGADEYNPPELSDMYTYDGGITNLKDYAVLAGKWSNVNCSDENNWCEGADINKDGIVNIIDLCGLVENWLAVSRSIRRGEVTVDGTVGDSEWANADWIPLDIIYYQHPNDITQAIFALQWNEDTNNIYAAIVVEDLDHVFADDYNNCDDWNASDRIEVFSQGDAAGGSGWSNMYDTAQQYMIGPDTKGGFWARWGCGQTLGPNSGSEAVVRVDGNTIIYEIGVLMFDNYGGMGGGETLITDLSAGKIVGFDVVVDTRHSYGFGMLSGNDESSSCNKSGNADCFAKYVLVE